MTNQKGIFAQKDDLGNFCDIKLNLKAVVKLLYFIHAKLLLNPVYTYHFPIDQLRIDKQRQMCLIILITFICMSQYAVQRIVGKKVENGANFFRIKWLGWPSSANTWEPQFHLPPELVKDYEQQQVINQKDKQKKERVKQLKKLYYPENVGLEKEIKSHYKSKTDGLMFVLRIGDRDYQLTRDEIMEKHSDLLCNYYLELARSLGKY